MNVPMKTRCSKLIKRWKQAKVALITCNCQRHLFLYYERHKNCYEKIYYSQMNCHKLSILKFFIHGVGEATEAAPHILCLPFSLQTQRNWKKYKQQTPKFTIMHHTLKILETKSFELLSLNQIRYFTK